MGLVNDVCEYFVYWQQEEFENEQSDYCEIDSKKHRFMDNVCQSKKIP